MTVTTRSGGDSAIGQPDCPWNETQQDALGDSHNRGDPVSSLDENVNCGGTLYHVGGVLRCRSVGPLRSLVRGNCDDRGTHPGSVPLRPTLRAYSAPLFLHSATFPPKSSTQTARGKPPAANSNTNGGVTSTRSHSCTPGERRGAGETNAPCRHRRGGYLHRFKGFEQEKVSCPPVATFRVIGGLGEFPRRRGNTAPAGTSRKHDGDTAPFTGGRAVQPSQQKLAASPVTTGRGGRGDSACALSQESPGSLSVELSHVFSAHEGQPSTYPLELFAEGSIVAPESPPDGGVAATPAWCSRTTGRPNGAKRMKAWGESDVRRGLPQNKEEMSKNKMKNKGGLTAGSKNASSRENRRLAHANATSSPYKKRSSAFLPYSLERPVSPERTRAFFYTSN